MNGDRFPLTTTGQAVRGGGTVIWRFLSEEKNHLGRAVALVPVRASDPAIPTRINKDPLLVFDTSDGFAVYVELRLKNPEEHCGPERHLPGGGWPPPAPGRWGGGVVVRLLGALRSLLRPRRSRVPGAKRDSR